MNKNEKELAEFVGETVKMLVPALKNIIKKQDCVKDYQDYLMAAGNIAVNLAHNLALQGFDDMNDEQCIELLESNNKALKEISDHFTENSIKDMTWRD